MSYMWLPLLFIFDQLSIIITFSQVWSFYENCFNSIKGRKKNNWHASASLCIAPTVNFSFTKLMHSIAEVCLVGSVLLIFSVFCVVLVFCVEYANYYTTDVVRLLMSINSMAHVVSGRKIFFKVWTIRNKIDSSIRTKWGIHVEYLFLRSHKMKMLNGNDKYWVKFKPCMVLNCSTCLLLHASTTLVG